MSPPKDLDWARTARLALREFGPDDEDALVGMHGDARLRRYLVDDYPLDKRPVVRLMLARLSVLYRRHEGLGLWHARLHAGAQDFVGWFNLMPMAERPGEVELGSRLLPSFWGQGLAFEGCERLLAHAFEDLAMPHVWGICHLENRSAQAVLAGLGFAHFGAMPYDGGIACHHRLERAAWLALRGEASFARLRRTLRAAQTRRAARPDPVAQEMPA
jgi:RimJ/RimL family protein N-acetyltransferase